MTLWIIRSGAVTHRGTYYTACGSPVQADDRARRAPPGEVVTCLWCIAGWRRGY